MMILGSQNADALRRLLLRGDDVPAAFGEALFTLPGLVESVATAVSFGPEHLLRQRIGELAGAKGGPLSLAWHAWWNPRPAGLGDDIHGIRTLEFFRLRLRADQNCMQFQLYQERFVRALKQGGFPRKFAEALAGTLVEMTDNVIQHSLLKPGEYSGLAAYHVMPDYMAFAVADIGQGVLSSLKQAEAWKHLNSAADGLCAAVLQHASSRPDQPKGEGFRTLFRSLADRNCRVRFRSDDAALTIADAGTHREAAAASSPMLAGLQLSACCSLQGNAEERSIEIY